MAETEIYSSQLREVFDTFDTAGEGTLGREALKELCRGLELEEYTDLLLNKVLGDNQGRKVQFDEFKEAFISILQEVSPSKEDPNSSVEVTPKYVLGGKTYGRRSKPDVLRDVDQEDQELADIERSANERLSYKQGGRVISPGSENEENGFHIKRRRKDVPRFRSSQDETFEAEGQLNLTMTEPDSDWREKLLEVWRTLGVGQDGYLTLEELRTVCNYIGMEMNDDEIWKLFKKLDNDHDGRVSFEELLSSFSQNSSEQPLTPSPRASRSSHRSQRPVGTPVLRSLSAQRKLRLASTPGERGVTPVVLSSGEVTGLFSSLDVQHTGFAQPEDVIDLWEKHNIMNGADILTALGFDQDTKLNLSELSFSLEQTLANEDLDVVSHAALVTCRQELRHLRSNVDALTSERNKLRLDLQEANARAALLAKEVDERHAHMEKSNEAKLLAIEKKYQDQIRSLQGALESERETHSAHSAKLCQNLEAEMEGLKHQEGRLKDNLSRAREEVERLQTECQKSGDSLEEANRLNTRLQQEMGSVENLRRKVAEYEQLQENDTDTQEYQHKIHWLEQANKDLKDKVDELTAELENLKQQLASCRRKLRGSSSSSHTKIPIREGTQLSDLSRPRRKSSLASLSSMDASEVEDQDSVRTRRRAPKLSSRKGKNSLEDDSSSEHSLSSSQKLELLEKDQQQIEHAYRLEVAQLEDRHQTEKENILQNFTKEKIKLREELRRQTEERLAEQQKELQNVFTAEKQDLLQRYESKKNLMVQEHTKEKEQLLNRLKDAEKDYKLRLERLKEDFSRERSRLEESRGLDRGQVRDLEKMVTDLEMRLKTERQEAEESRQKDREKLEEERELWKKNQNWEKEKMRNTLEAEYRQKLQQATTENSQESSTPLTTSSQDQRVIEGLQERIADIELQLQLQREKIEAEGDRQREEMERRHQLQLEELETRYKLQLLDMETALEQGVSGLQGKLKEDFYTLLEESREESVGAERSAMYQDLEAQRVAMEAERQELLQQLEQRRVQFEEERQKVLEELDQKRKVLNEECEELEQRKNDFDEESHKILDELDRQETDCERARDQMRKKKEEFEDARRKIEENLEEQRKELEGRLQTVGQQQTELECERRRLLEEVHQKELQLEAEAGLLEEKLQSFEQMKSSYEDSATKHETDINSDLQKRLIAIEAEEQLLLDKKNELVLEQQKQLEVYQSKEKELEEEEAELSRAKSAFEAERTELMKQLQKEKDQLKEDQEQLLVRQRDIEKEHSSALSSLNTEREKLKEEAEELKRRRSEVEEEHSLALKEMQTQREDLRVEQKELDTRKKDVESEHRLVLEDLQTQKDEVRVEKEKLLQKEKDLERDHLATVRQLEERRGEVEREKETEKMTIEELRTHHQQQEEELKISFEREKETLCRSYEEEKSLLMEKYQDEILGLQRELGETRHFLEERQLQVEALAERQAELEAAEEIRSREEAQQVEDQRQRELELIQAVREEMQSNHVRQITELQEAFQGEQKLVKEQTRVMEEQISDLQEDLLSEQERSRVAAEHKQKTISRLQAQLKQVEEIRDSLQDQLLEAERTTTQTRERLQRRVDELLSEKEAVVVATRAEVVDAAQRSHDKEKEQVHEELKEVSSKMVAVQDQLTMVTDERDELLQYKRQYEECYEDKQAGDAEIRELKQSVGDLEETVQQLQNIKVLYEQSEAERDRLETQLRESLQTAGEITVRSDVSLVECGQELLVRERDELKTQLRDVTEKLRSCQSASRELEKLRSELSRVKRERTELQEKLNSHRDNKQDGRGAKRREDKEQANAALDEKKKVEHKLQKVSDKLLKASTDLSVAQSQHLQEISRWKDCTKNMVDLEQFTNLQLGLIEQQRHMNELQASLQEKLELIEDLKDGHKKLVKQLEADKKELHTRLEHSHKLFKEQGQKLVKTYDSLAERNLLVKSLHEENCQLAKKVKIGEDRQRMAEKRCLHAERKCAGLQKVINQACQNIDNNLP